jgi:hypothetical protein
MLTLDETWDLARDLNEEAHESAWDTWVEADNLENSDDEDDWEEAEAKREEASGEQASYFRDLYRQLEDGQRNAILHWLSESTEFKEEFSTWFGEEEFENEFGKNDEK